MEEILKEFENLGMNASYHYADDSGKEWGLGSKYMDKALAMFDDHPECQNRMRKIAKGFLCH